MREILLQSFETVMHYRIEVTTPFNDSVRGAASYIADMLYKTKDTKNLSDTVTDSLIRDTCVHFE